MMLDKAPPIHSNPLDSTYDIVIVGAGIIGLSLACGLQKLQKKIAVLDTGDLTQIRPNSQQNAQLNSQLTDSPSSPSSNKPIRFSAINQQSKCLFKQWNVWSDIVAQGISPFRHMTVWDAQAKGSIHFDNHTMATQSLGYIISDQVIRWALYNTLLNASNVNLMSQVKMEKWMLSTSTKVGASPPSIKSNRPNHSNHPNYPNHQVIVTLDNGITLTTDLVIGADGSHSKVRECAEIASYSWPYHQQALVATVHTAQSHRKTAWQVFLPNGPLAFLPLSDPHHSTIVWSTDYDDATQLSTMKAVDFNTSLTQASDSRLGKVTVLSERHCFPLRMQHAKTYVKPHMALVGDAIHTIHPLAGQGVNLGLQDVAVLTRVLEQAVSRGNSLGSLTVLRRYARARKSANWSMIATVELFNRLLGRSPMGWVRLRSLGLNAVDRMTVFKRLIMHYAGSS